MAKPMTMGTTIRDIGRLENPLFSAEISAELVSKHCISAPRVVNKPKNCSD
jgi:hypothetical protein